MSGFDLVRNRLPLLAGGLLALMGLVGCGRDPRSLQPQAPQSLEFFVFTTEDGVNTRFWLADPAKPSVRKLLITVEHRPNWAGVASVAPNGKAVAFTVLSQNERDPDREASLKIYDVESRQTRTLAGGVDLRSTLVWSPDGGAVTYQRFDGSQQQIWSQGISGQAATKVDAAEHGERILPLTLDQPAGQILEASFSEHGVDLRLGRRGTSAEQLQHLSDGAARDFSVSPGGGQIAYLTTARDGADPVSRAYVLDVGGSAIKELPADWGEIVGVAWGANSELVVGSAGSAAGLYTEGGSRLPSQSTSGFLQPLSWSASGKYLAVRAFSGTSGAQPGSARDALMTQKGKLVSITDSLPVRFVGWMSVNTQDSGK